MQEIDFQRKIVKWVEEQGGWARKLSHRTMVGLPDLLVKLPTHDAALIEVKYLRTHGTLRKCGLTALQARELTNFTKAGGKARVVVISDRHGSKLHYIQSIAALPGPLTTGLMFSPPDNNYAWSDTNLRRALTGEW